MYRIIKWKACHCERSAAKDAKRVIASAAWQVIASAARQRMAGERDNCYTPASLFIYNH